MTSDSYKTIKTYSLGIYKDRGSRFIAEAYPAEDAGQVKLLVEKARKEHHDARHHCFAYMIGPERENQRVNDDGEPPGTAGKPILGQINSYGLTNILIIVSRYFGGTLLGVSGLINAYRKAAESAIMNAVIIEKTLTAHYEITFPYSSLNEVMKTLKEENAGHTVRKIDLRCSIAVHFRSQDAGRIIGRLARIEGLEYRHISTR
ncbi:MAG: YigZ family protein [Bacteroidales bacterium]|nr:YigZ family protein [Bacteroidales bacterium]